jgi:hypothetical protein
MFSSARPFLTALASKLRGFPAPFSLGAMLCLAGLHVIPGVCHGQTTNSASSGNKSNNNDNALLLDLLVKKGFVTQSEAEQVMAESDRLKTNFSTNSYTKWKIGDGIKNMELFGDIRLRYENRQVRTPDNGAINLDRYRYALRLGLRGDAEGNVYYGLRLETSSNPRSPWVTFSSSSSGAPYQGPFGKSTSGINLGQIYLGWKPNEDVDLTVGKMANPLFTTPMVWDSDLNPEGAAERFKYDIGPAQFFATFGQFIYEDVNPTTSTPFLFSSTDPGHNANPPFLMAMQGGVNYKLSKDMSFKVGGTLYNYLGHGSVTPTNGPLQGTPGFSDDYVGEGAGGVVPGYPDAGASGYPGGAADGFYYNQTGVNDLLVMEFPAEFNFKLWGQHVKIFGDFAENLDGEQRAEAAVAAAANPNIYATPMTIPLQKNQNKAYQAGFAVGNSEELGQAYGSAIKRGAWETRFYWQHVEQYSLDPNLIDSDFFEGRENMQGVYLAFAYGFTDNLVGTVRYGYASRIDKKLGTGGSNLDVPQVNPVDQYQLLQLDLALKL